MKPLYTAACSVPAPSPSSACVRVRRRARATLLSLVAGVIVAEACLRLFWPHEVETAQLAERVAEFKFGAMKRFSADPVLYFELAPDLRTRQGNAWIVTDGEGFRIPETPPVPAPEATGAPVRVALVGPSTAFGWKIPWEQTYGERVRRRLEERWRRPVELRNFGVPAYNTIQQERLLTTKILPWRPRFILWNYDHRDAYPVISLADPIGLPPDFGDNALHSACWKLLRRRWREWELERTRYAGDDYTVHANYLTSGRAWEEHLQALERVAGIAAAAQVPIVLFIHDAFIERLPADPGHFEKLHRPVLDHLARLPQFRVIDLFPRYQELMAERSWKDLKPIWISLLPQDGHPNGEGHAFIAEELVEFVGTMPDLP